MADFHSDEVASFCRAGISEPMPVAATFFMPSISGSALSSFARIDTMVRGPITAPNTFETPRIMHSRQVADCPCTIAKSCR